MKNELRHARRVRGVASPRSGTRRSPRSTTLYQRRLARPNAVDFDDLLMLTVQLLERHPGRARAAGRSVPLHPRRRVPGHEPRAVPPARSSSREHGNSASSGTTISRSTASAARHPQHPRVRAATSPTRRWSSSSRTTARRSTILDAANAVIATTRQRKEKKLFTEPGRASRSALSRSRTSTTEAQFVAAEIAGLIDSGQSASEVAVFYRTNAQSRVSRRCSCGRTCRTRSSAGRGSTSARRSATRSPT